MGRVEPTTVVSEDGTGGLYKLQISPTGGISAVITTEAGVSIATNAGTVLTTNASATPLTGGASYTGTWVDVSMYSSITMAVYTDQSGTLYGEFSTNGTNADSSLSFSVSATTNEVHRLTVTRKYFRVRYVNGSVAQTYLRMQCMAGMQPPLTSALNSVIQADADALLVRPLDFNLMVAEGLYQARNNTIKDGVNFDIDTGSTPEDISNEGGVYAGFPTGAVEAAQIVAAGADTGTVYYSYMASASDTDYTFGAKAITGAGTYALGHNIWRCNFAYFVSSSATAFNAGDITIRNTPTTTNIFCVINAGFSQSYCAAYTVPASSDVYLDRITGNMRGATTGAMDGYFWYRATGESPRLRFPFELQYGTLYFDDVDYLIKIPAGVDIIPRITYASTNNLVAKISYRLIKVKR